VSAQRYVADVVASATGRDLRDDPVLPVSGGPAGNAQMTAWMGLLLLVLFLAELLTLIDVRHLISWHIAIGIVLVPPALAKTATTGWRILRYYTGAEPYHRGGPPPLVLRLLGPLVVITTLGLLATGIVVLVLGPTSAFEPWISIGGLAISALSLHQGCTVVWAVATGLHVLARTVPAVRLSFGTVHGGRTPGVAARLSALIYTVAIGLVAAVLVLRLSVAWTSGDLPRGGERERGAEAAASTGLRRG
jgi:hypothetical protein